MTPVMLYLHFALYGFLCFGGGYMLIPFITADLVNGGFLSQAEFANLSSIAQITPGPIGLNTATYVGYLQSGFPGSLLASLGLVTPAFLMVIMALKLLKRYENTVFIKGFLAGMKPASLGFTCAALLIFMGMSLFTAPLPLGERLKGVFTAVEIRWCALPIIIVSVILLKKTKIPFPLVLLLCAAMGAFLLK
jgi:chromate transporter